MGTIGELLKKTRTERGLTLEEAAHVTRVRLHYLRALEEDQRDILPSLVQGRGYLRLYADYLKLDSQPLLAAWETNLLPDAAPDAAPVEPVEPEPEPEPEPVKPAAVETLRTYTPTPAIETMPPLQPETASEVVFVEVGQRLQNQREALGISLAEAEKYTHVRQHYLYALEQGRLDQLPSPVQGRGMLNNYARFLNMDADALLSHFADGLQLRREERLENVVDIKSRPLKPRDTKTNAQKPVKSMGLRRLLTPDLMIGGTLLVLMMIFFIWGANRLNLTNSDNLEITATAPSISEMLLITGTPNPQEIPVTDTPRPAIENGAIPDPGGELPAETVVGTPINTDPLQVYVIARQRAWLQITADGKVVFRGRTIPGNAYAYSGNQRLELSTGNAGGLQVFFNQNDLGTLGAVGQAISLVFTPGSVITPTSAFTATPTLTVQPTLTPFPTPTRPTPTITPFIP